MEETNNVKCIQHWNKHTGNNISEWHNINRITNNCICCYNTVMVAASNWYRQNNNNAIRKNPKIKYSFVSIGENRTNNNYCKKEYNNDLYKYICDCGAFFSLPSINRWWLPRKNTNAGGFNFQYWAYIPNYCVSVSEYLQFFVPLRHCIVFVYDLLSKMGRKLIRRCARACVLPYYTQFYFFSFIVYSFFFLQCFFLSVFWFGCTVIISVCLQYAWFASA